MVSSPVSKKLSRASSKSPSSQHGHLPSTSSTNSPPCKRRCTKPVHVPQSLSVNSLLELVRALNIAQERSFNITELGSLFREAVQEQQWEEALARMASVRLNLTLVREFYANLAAALGPSRKAQSIESKTVRIRGQTILFSPSSIRYSLSLPMASIVDKQRVDSELNLLTKEEVIKRCYLRPPPKMPTDLSCGQLHVSHRALCHLVRAMLYPTTQTSQLPLVEAKLLCYLTSSHKKIPAEFFLFESIKKSAISIARGNMGTKSSLFHPAVISIFCLQQGIETHEGDEFGSPLKLTMSSVIRGNAQSLSPGPSLDVEATLRMATLNATAFATSSHHRLSAIDCSVTGLRTEILSLQRTVGKLHSAFVAAVAAGIFPSNVDAEDVCDSPANQG